MRFATLGLVVLVASCGGPELPDPARETVVAWLECDDCTDGELSAVVAAGSSALATLREALLNGPSRAREEEERAHLIATYERLIEYQRIEGDISLPDRDQYIEMYIQNLVARYRIRAAIAMEAVGGSSAVETLQEVPLESLRDDVRDQMVTSLARLGAATRR